MEAAEAVLDRLGFGDRRVRHFGTVARVELPLEMHGRAQEAWAEIVDGIRSAGFEEVELVADGLRSGRLNDALGDPA